MGLLIRSEVALDHARWQAGHAAVRTRKRLRWRHVLSMALIAATAAAVAGDRWWRLTTIESIPKAPAPTAGLFADPIPITISVSAAGQRAPWTTTEQELRGNVELWKRMHLADWDGVPAPLRTVGLNNMLGRYVGILNRPAMWDKMTVFDWDAVPEPIRTIAYRRMVAYWSGWYDVGAEFNLPAADVADTLAAIVMSESWFNHRARSMNRDGWDTGLAQASPYARARLRALYGRGEVDADLSDEDYDNPWIATRFVALWMKLMLAENGGDLERAIRAYNRGSAEAMDTLGAGYLAAVQRRLTRYIRNSDASPSWDHVWSRSRTLRSYPASAPAAPQARAAARAR